jgi:hypothetical protein
MRSSFCTPSLNAFAASENRNPKQTKEKKAVKESREDSLDSPEPIPQRMGTYIPETYECRVCAVGGVGGVECRSVGFALTPLTLLDADRGTMPTVKMALDTGLTLVSECRTECRLTLVSECRGVSG